MKKSLSKKWDGGLFIFVYWILYYLLHSTNLLFFRENPRYGTIINLCLKLFYLYIIVIYLLSKKRLIKARSLTNFIPLILVLFLGWIFSSILWTKSNFNVAILYWSISIIEIVPIFIFIKIWDIKKIIYYTTRGIVVGGIILAFIGIWNGFDSIGRLGNDEFLHPNILGNLLAISSISCLGILSEQKRLNNEHNLRYFVILIYLLILLLLTVSKTAIISFFVVFLIFVLANKSSKREKIILILFFVLITVQLYISYINSYLSNYMQNEKYLYTLTGRTIIWEYTWRMIKLSPLIGYGFFAFREIGPQIAAIRLGSAHNDYLNVIFNFGFIGLFLYLGVIIDYIRKLILVSFFAKKQYESEFIISLLFLIYFSIRGFSEANFATINFVLPLLILLVSLLTCIGRKENLVSCSVDNNTKKIKSIYKY